MRAALVLVAATLAAASPAGAETLADAIATAATDELPAELAVVAVHVPARVERRHPAPAVVAVEWPRAPRAGRISVRVTADGRAVGLIAVTLAPLEDHPIATRDLPIGARIGPTDVVVIRRPRQPGVTPADHAVGATVLTAIAAGAPIARTAVARPAPVARDRAVAVESRAGAITLRTTGRLVASARPGELAHVRLTTGVTVHGRLWSEDLVVLEEEP